MKMRNIVFGAMLMVLLMAVPVAIAEEASDSIDANTLEEAKVMTTPLGAEVRLLQLEKNITRNVLTGAKVVEVIQANHPEADVNAAQLTLDKLESLLDEVKATDLTQDKNELVTAFVAAKKEATDLAKEFRGETSTLLTAEDKKEVRDAVKDLDKNELKEINAQIRQEVRRLNAERIGDLLDKAGMSNHNLVEKIKDGNITAKEIRDDIVNAYNDLNEEKKNEVAAKVKEHTIKRTVEEKELQKEAKVKGLERALQNQANRLERVGEWISQHAADANASGYEARAQRLERTSEQLKNMSDRIEQITKNKEKGQGN